MDARFLVAPVNRGMDRYLIGLATELVRRGVDVVFLHRAREPLHAPHVPPGVTVQAVDDRGGVFWEQLAVPRALHRGGFDLYHAPAERGVPYLSPCPVVLTYHSTTSASYRDLTARGLLPGTVADYLGRAGAGRRSLFDHYHWWQQFRAAHVLTPSQFSRDELIRLNGLAPDRVTVTPLAVAPEFHAPATPVAELRGVLSRLNVAEPYLLYVGGYELHKNVAGLLEMFSRVYAVRPALQLVCVGSAPAPAALVARRAALNLPATSVRILAGLSRELVPLYDGAALFATLSWRETFGLPALEAMTRGKPVVASEWGAAPEVVGDAGILVDPRDAPAAAAATLDLLARGDVAGLGERARIRSRQFSWARTGELTLAVYHRLLERRRASRRFRRGPVDR